MLYRLSRCRGSKWHHCVSDDIDDHRCHHCRLSDRPSNLFFFVRMISSAQFGSARFSSVRLGSTRATSMWSRNLIVHVWDVHDDLLCHRADLRPRLQAQCIILYRLLLDRLLFDRLLLDRLFMIRWSTWWWRFFDPVDWFPSLGQNISFICCILSSLRLRRI